MGNLPFKLNLQNKSITVNENSNSLTQDMRELGKVAEQAAKAASEYHSQRHTRVKQRELDGIKLSCVQKWASGDYEEEFGHTGNYCICRLYGPYVHCNQA